jgi:hypothetical protein
MLGRYWLEKRGSKAAPKTSAAPAQNRATKPPPAPEPQTAKEKILTLLQSPDGATTAEMIKASGWQAHSVRAFLSRLRKKHTIVTNQAGNLLYYQLKSAQR